jgi:hypothetical protein
MTDRLSEAAMLAVVLGDAGAPPDYNDWFCERCGKIFAQKGNLKRHWRQPRPCEICGWTTTFRDDKFSCYRSHHREDHQENGVPMQSVDELRTYWKRTLSFVTSRTLIADCQLGSSHVNEIIDPNNCRRPLDHNVAGDLLATDVGSDIGYGDAAGIEHLPPSQSETENTLGEDAHPLTNTPSSSATALHPEDASLWGNPATDHLTMLDDFQLSEWVYGMPSIPQPDGMITGLGSGTSSMPQMTGEREWLVAEVCA